MLRVVAGVTLNNQRNILPGVGFHLTGGEIEVVIVPAELQAESVSAAVSGKLHGAGLAVVTKHGIDKHVRRVAARKVRGIDFDVKRERKAFRTESKLVYRKRIGRTVDVERFIADVAALFCGEFCGAALGGRGRMRGGIVVNVAVKAEIRLGIRSYSIKAPVYIINRKLSGKRS